MDDEFKKSYHNLVESLKKHQRAELLNSENENIIEELYTDPFEGDAVLKAMLDDQTTLLIGRKGSGKSTIINRLQYEIRKSKDKLALYIDVRTIYSRSKNSSDTLDDINALNIDEQTKFSIYHNFISKFIDEIKEEINKNIFETNKTLKQKISSLFKKDTHISIDEFIVKLEEILNNSCIPNYKDVTKIKRINKTSKQSSEDTEGVSLSVEVSAIPKVAGGINNIEKQTNADEINFSQILIREFQIVKFAEEIKQILEEVGIKKIYICLDDSSELDQEALEMFVKTIVAPLHNDSGGFFRFKIAFYPERNTLPDIDRTKIDTFSLDYYQLYKSSNADKVEEQAISYIKRLVRQRIKYYFKNENISEIENKIFDIKNVSIDEYYKILFYACSCIPRNIGKILYYAEKRSVSQGKQINKNILQESAEEQYNNDIYPVISRDEFFQYKSYGEIFKRTQLKNLLNLIVEKAKDNKKRIGDSDAEIFKDFNTSNAPSHYLYVKKGENESFLSTLEINFFITRISEQKDKGDYKLKKFISNDIVVYTLNYGLCQKENIIFDESKNRKYRIERIFDFNKLVEDWANDSAIVKCNHCGQEYDISEWDTIVDFECLCRKCKTKNSCELIRVFDGNHYNDKDNNFFPENPTKILKDEQLRIIHCLYIESNMTENDIASELDVSQETVRAYLRSDRKLRDLGYINKNEDKTYYLTEKSKNELYNAINN